MVWVELRHIKCKRPSLDEIVKDGALPGSIWKCANGGCSKTYILLEDKTWVRANKPDSYVAQADAQEIRIQGLDEELDEYDGLTPAERARLFEIREKEVNAAVEREKRHRRVEQDKKDVLIASLRDEIAEVRETNAALTQRRGFFQRST